MSGHRLSPCNGQSAGTDGLDGDGTIPLASGAVISSADGRRVAPLAELYWRHSVASTRGSKYMLFGFILVTLLTVLTVCILADTRISG